MAGHTINEGDRFGKLVVITEVESRIDSKTGWKKDKMYRCQCDCGEETTVTKYHLISGTTKSCGCLRGAKERQDSSPTPPSCGCIYCGSDDYYSGGLCRNCYFKSMRGSLSREIESMIPMY